MRRAIGFVLALSASACGADTGTVDVVLRTDLRAGDAFARIRTELFDALPEEGGSASDRPQEVEVAGGEDYGDGRRVAQFGPLIAGTWTVRVQLITRAGRVHATDAIDVEVEGTTEVVVEIGDEDVNEGSAPCATGLDASTVALYTFDADEGGSELSDSTGGHPGAMVGGDVQVLAGLEGCGDALLFPEDADVHAEIPHDPAFDVERGSVELWVRPHAPSENATQGILSRDAVDTERPGHFTLWFAPDGSVVARLQNPDGEAVRCSNEPLELDQWSRVGVNFGPEGFEMFVDGVMATRTDAIEIDPSETSRIDCGGGTVGGLAGNENPWVIGKSASGSMEGTADPLYGYFRGGAVDQIRISSARRSFDR